MSKNQLNQPDTDYAVTTSGMQASVARLEYLLNRRRFNEARDLVNRMIGQLNMVILSTHQIELDERRLDEARKLEKARIARDSDGVIKCLVG